MSCTLDVHGANVIVSSASYVRHPEPPRVALPLCCYTRRRHSHPTLAISLFSIALLSTSDGRQGLLT